MPAYVETTAWYTQTSVHNELISDFNKDVGKKYEEVL
jgi:hypothetical protein